MKKITILSVLFVSMIMIVTSCKKNNSDYTPVGTKSPRRVQFVLFSDKDLSNDNNTITITLSIERSANDILWDSVLPPMRIKDIPTQANALTVEKYLPGNVQSLVKAGFHYTIDNVGNSSHMDPFEPGENFKIVSFNFQ
ncbi:MAG TPA: hypothetical protein VFU29_16035 [Chitinophagaceae bacterium]|nr:hypothetical protein [Chitinophagaceae bacterium]